MYSGKIIRSPCNCAPLWPRGAPGRPAEPAHLRGHRGPKGASPAESQRQIILSLIEGAHVYTRAEQLLTIVVVAVLYTR